MLAGLPKRHPSFIKLCKNPLIINSRLFASISTRCMRARLSKNKQTASRGDGGAKREGSRPPFGLRPPDKEPWDESDPRFAKEDPSLALRFRKPSKMRTNLRKEGKLRVDKKGPPKLFPLTEIRSIELQEESNERKRALPPHQLEHFGTSSDIMSMSQAEKAISTDGIPRDRASVEVVVRRNVPVGVNRVTDPGATLEILNLMPDTKLDDLRAWCNELGGVSEISLPIADPSYCRIRLSSHEQALLAKERLAEKDIFLSAPLIRLSSVAKSVTPTRFLMIHDFKGLRSDLVEATGCFIATDIHLLPVQVKGAKLRIDALMRFHTEKDAFGAYSRLERRNFGPTDNGTYVQMIDSNRYLSVLNPPDKAASMAEFSITPSMTNSQSRGLQSINASSNSTLWLGNIPGELLEQKEQIIAKFSKYGQLADVRIPDKGTNRPRGYMYLEFVRPEDAEACFQELTQRPIFLFGRQLRVDYAPSKAPERPPYGSPAADGLSPRTVFLSGLRDNLINDPWALLDIVSQFGEIVDLRIVRSPPTAFVDFMHPGDAKKMVQDVVSRRVNTLPSGIYARHGTKLRRPEWDDVIKPLCDTLRVIGIPLRALRDTVILREAFGDKRKLINIKTVKDNGWPIGVVYLQFASVDAAKETLDWMHSDPENPITFFGREVSANFAENRNPRAGMTANPRHHAPHEGN